MLRQASRLLGPLLGLVLCLMLAACAKTEADQKLDRFIRAKQTILSDAPAFYQRASSAERKALKAAGSLRPAEQQAETIVKAAGFEDLLEYITLDTQIALLSLNSLTDQFVKTTDDELARRRQEIEAELKNPHLTPARRAQLQACLQSNCENLAQALNKLKNTHLDFKGLPGLDLTPELIQAIKNREQELQALNQKMSEIKKRSKRIDTR